MVTARAGRGGKLERVFGTFHSLPAELQETIIVAAKRGASKIDLSQKLGKVLLDENQTSSISSYYVEITRKNQVVILLHGCCSCS